MASFAQNTDSFFAPQPSGGTRSTDVQINILKTINRETASPSMLPPPTGIDEDNSWTNTFDNFDESMWNNQSEVPGLVQTNSNFSQNQGTSDDFLKGYETIPPYSHNLDIQQFAVVTETPSVAITKNDDNTSQKIENVKVVDSARNP